MNLFIPELGTQFKLSKDWAFTLYAERRNLILFQALQGEKERATYLKKRQEAKEELEKLRNLIINDPKASKSFGLGRGVIFNDSKYYLAYKTAQENYWDFLAYREAKSYKTKQHIFPKGTVLEVDRIYIRQGAAKFSSVTFKIRDKKVLRFWAKLDDVNRIEFDQASAPALERAKSIPRCSIGG